MVAMNDTDKKTVFNTLLNLLKPEFGTTAVTKC